MRNFHLTFQQAEDDRTDQADLVYSVRRASSPINKDTLGLSVVLLQGRYPQVNQIQFSVPDEDLYINVTVVDEAGNVSFYENRFVEAKPEEIELLPPAHAPQNIDITPNATTASISYNLVDTATSYQYRVNQGIAIGIGTNNPFNINGLEPNVEYNLQMRAVNSAGSSDWSDNIPFTTDQMDAPANAPEFSITNVGLTSATINRTSSVSGATSYQYRVNEGLPAIMSDTSETIQSLAQNNNYAVQMRAVNAGGESDWSDPITFTTDAEVTQIPQVVLMQPSQFDEAIITTISSSQHAESYEYRINQGSITNIGNYLEFAISGLEDGEGYELELRARNSYGTTNWSTPTVFTFDITGPSISNKTLTGTVDSNDEDSSNWTLNIAFAKATDNITTNEDIVYELYTGDPANLSDPLLVTGETLAGSATDVAEFTIPIAQAETINYNVIAKDNQGNISLYTANSSTAPDPQVLSLEPVEDNYIGTIGDGQQISWNIDTQDGASAAVHFESLTPNIVSVTQGGVFEILDQSEAFVGQVRGYSVFDPSFEFIVDIFVEMVVVSTSLTETIVAGGAEISFDKMLGDNSSNYEYELYSGNEAELQDIDLIESQILENSGVDVDKLLLQGVEGEFKDYNLLVKDPLSGIKVIYQLGGVFFPDPEISFPEVYLQDPNSNFNPEPVTSIELSSEQGSLIVYVTIDAWDGASDVVNLFTTNASKMSVEMIGKNKAEITYIDSDPGDVVILSVVPEEDANFAVSIPVNLYNDEEIEDSTSETNIFSTAP